MSRDMHSDELLQKMQEAWARLEKLPKPDVIPIDPVLHDEIKKWWDDRLGTSEKWSRIP